MPHNISEPSRSSDFSPVARKKRRNKTYQSRPLLERVQRILDELCGYGEDAVWAEEVKEIFQENITAMRSRPARCNCLGLGSPEDSEAARVQLALLLHLGDKLELPRSNVTLYDPQFTDADYKLFDGLGLRGLREEPDHFTTEPTLFYMIHCDMTLYESVLKANESNLEHILLAGNRLHHYVENKPTRELGKDAPTLLRLAPRMDARVLPSSPSWPNAMAFTAVQRLQGLDEEGKSVDGRAAGEDDLADSLSQLVINSSDERIPP
ncbi:SRR1-domain-containing protein [Schizophyllum commune]